MPIYPEKDVLLLQGWPEPITEPVLWPVGEPPNDQTNPEVDITLLPGVPNQRGPQGEPGIVAATSPLVYNANAQTISLNESLISVDASQITGFLPASQVSGLPEVSTYTHTQNAVSSTWTITHNLGFYPNVTTLDSAGTTIEGSIAFVSLDEITISFSVGVTGTAYLS